MKTKNIMILAIVLVYIISPIDLLPLNPVDDVIVGIIGWVLRDGGK